MALLGIALTSCHRSSEVPSLVGAKNLPSCAELHKETLFIAREGGANWKELLNIEIWPSNRVIAAHYRGQDQTTPIARENLRMSATDIERVRRMLWRLRPDDGAPAQKTVPVGCTYIYDTGYEWSVGYVRQDQPTKLLQFSLPSPDQCESAAYAEAQKVVAAAMRALPASRVIEQFPTGRANP